MQSDPSDLEEETPSLLWGWDPGFLAFAKMYIKDILEMKESRQVPSVFFYKGHPIKQVDVLGTVVHKKERENFYNYGVDDSTAVINCICWKDLEEMETAPLDKVDDPVCEVQISRMLELPYIYSSIYDQPFQVSQRLKEESQEIKEGSTCEADILGASDRNSLTFPSLVRQLSEKVQSFLVEDRVENFYWRELESMEPFMSMASQPLCSDQEDSGTCSTSRQVHRVFKDVLRLLQEKGVVFQKSPDPEKVYHVTDYERELHGITIGIIQVDCKRARHAEKGCHFLHILSGVRQSYSPHVSEAVMQRVLDVLERNSDVISTMEKFYVAL
ncbi:CST complex subunit STN1 isoform X6 [Rhinatrema bivittatum]|uniref:CST complex subunit STN1 isoform X6 n=1 Tax=Rhinatrema bivittatum TaxID=194408 RepID=UPI00112EF786|nr:CST complex subunit STN1 isoform X6 [Rhinatrema bivittatum]